LFDYSIRRKCLSSFIFLFRNPGKYHLQFVWYKKLVEL
jgi:hypothetical protein